MIPILLRSFLYFRSCALVLCMGLFLAACSGDKKDEDELESVTVPVDQLYNEAKAALEDKKYKVAVEKFEAVEQQHPYSEWATRAQVMAGYTNYRQEEYDGAIAILDRFVRMHPGNENVAYAYYLIALCYYEQISDVGREQSMTAEAQRTLLDVVRRFPDTEYARDARIKLDLVIDHLAGKEMEVGRYYLERGDVLAAINRFKYVVDHYQTTTHTPEALHRLTEGYMALGVDDEARKYAAVLGYNYSDSEWYQDSYRLLVPEAAAALDAQGTTTEDNRAFWKRWLPNL